ncbi:MAG: hypothetical protein Q9218_002241 [Villophora microphyllina]
MPSNEAAYLSAKSTNPLEVKFAPYTPPGEKEIVVKNGAVAVNPVEWGKQVLGDLMFSWIKYPFVLGSDLAGEVVEVGKGVTRFKPGDRVLGHAVATAKPTGKALLVWGGSTSVGSNAIQLGVAAGYEVFTTASPKNFDYVKKLGASRVWDYHSDTAVHDIITALGEKQIVGAVAVGNGSIEKCIDIVAAAKGRKFVAQASVPWPETMPSSTMGTVALMFSFVWSNISVWLRSKLKRVETKFIFGSDLMVNEVSNVIYEDYLPAALADGKYLAAPDPQVVGKGLEHVQEALDLNMKGVSAKKLVVAL